ncbi:hypothetical protein NC651_038126 [Populus alba x Populus x berolinensis]|nr:hypothetical protein NC651_038126 [Populus alba x Populus x berolinensis]
MDCANCEAYNELHGLAPELKTPFDEPAVLLVGQQTDGKRSRSGGRSHELAVAPNLVAPLFSMNYSASLCGKSRREMILLEIAVGIDPELSKTVVGSTKRDTRIP